MNQRLNPLWRGAAVLAGAMLCVTVQAQTVPNPSFEANSFSTAPGFISDNAEITGWVADNPLGAGLSPAGGDSTFADNGTIPDGQNVAFITGGTTLGTTITGLTSGEVYKLTLRANATTNQQPILRATVDGVDILALNIYTVGGTAPYQYVAFEFTATGPTAVLGLVNDATFEHTLLVDDLKIAESSGRWTVEAWTDDATSGVDNQYVYTHAYSVGAGANAVINGVPFTGVAGANPSVADKFVMARFPSVFNGDANNITGGSATLGRDFLYSGASIASGTYQTITLTNLTPGTEYVATIYSAGWEDPTTGARWATFSVGEDRLTLNQDAYFNNNGIRISHRYTAPADGSVQLRIGPINPVNVSIHVYGFSNREAVSRNVPPSITVQPRSTILAEGLPLSLNASAAGFPAPTFQWRFNGNNIATGTEGTYTIASVTPQNAGNYDVIVANQMGSVTSLVARVVVGLPMVNSSFEADAFYAWPGYSEGNPGSATTPSGPNVPITGWNQFNLNNSGINPLATGESPFANNGVIPHGNQVAFIQSLADPNGMSQTAAGLTAGSQYYLHYYENSRTTANPLLEVTLNGEVAVPAHLVPSGAYRGVYSGVFTAAGSSVDIAFNSSSPGGADTTVLIDNVTIVPVPANTAPFITREPVATAAPLNGSATFTAQAIGSLPLSFQWLRNGTPIQGETNATLTLDEVSLDEAGDYALRATNSAGSVTTAAARLTVNQPVPGLFNTGVNDQGEALADSEIDPHYEIIVNPHIESVDAIVQDSTVFPIVAGPWLANTDSSKWIGPEFNTAAGAVGLYTYRLVFDLTGRNPSSVSIQGRWATDNAGRDIRVNGVSTGNPENPGFNAYTPFAIYGTNTTFNAGTNTLDFIVENVDAIGYTGLRVEFLQSNAAPSGGGGTGATMSIARDGANITISWTAGANQTLQSATNIDGPWTPVPNASTPYTTQAAGNHRFFRVAQ